MVVPVGDPLAQLSLPPGFRFYPTDEELMVQYLCRKVAGHHFSLPIIGEIDLYKFDPWDLPSKAIFGEKEWYFFSPRDRKYPNGSRPNRVAGSGYWKATGTDKVITTEGRKVGIKKALVFYIGKAPKGTKTNWIMHEYRLFQPSTRSSGSKLDDWVLCRIYKKNSSGAKPMASGTSQEQSTGGSSSSSSSHLDDVLESLSEIDDRFFDYSEMRINQQEDQKLRLQNFGSGGFDWSVLAGLTAGPEIGATGLGQAQAQGQHLAGQVINDGTDMYLPSLPQLCHVDSPEKYGHRMEEEVQSGLRTQRVNSSWDFFSQSPSAMLAQSYQGSVDPFAIRYTAPMGGFGFRQ